MFYDAKGVLVIKFAKMWIYLRNASITPEMVGDDPSRLSFYYSNSQFIENKLPISAVGVRST